MEKTVKVELAGNLEARPIAMLVQLASKFDSTIYLMSGGRKVNAKSIMGMMGLKLKNGDDITILTEGEDESDALSAIETYFMNVDK